MASMTFLINDTSTGGNVPIVQVTIAENADGSVSFTVTQLAGYVGDLRGLFFDVADESLVGTLTGSGTGLTEFVQGNDSVIDLGGGANLQGLATGGDGGGYDVGVEIGSSGLKTNDDIRSFTFTLDSDLRNLSLADFSNVSFGARVTSVGLDSNLDGSFETSRSGSSKTGEVTFAVITPTKDCAAVLEDGTASGNLLANDGAGAGDVLTVTGWSGGVLNTDLVFADFANVKVRVNSDGSYAVDASAADALALGETVSHTFTYDVLQSNAEGTSTHTVSFKVTVTGTNDAPTVSAHADGAVTEDAAATTLSTTVSVDFNDVDLADTLSYAFVKSSGTLGGTLSLLSSDDSGAGASGAVSYTYSVANSATQSLAAGQQATETFTITASDGHGGTASQLVTVVVTGTNDAPDVRVEAGDSALAVLEEGNGPGRIASGTLTVTDVDLADSVTAAVDAVTLVGTTGGLTAADVLGMLHLTPWGFLAPDGNLAADEGHLNNLRWNFEPGSTSFDFLAAGESLTLNYQVRCSDGAGASDTQTVAITITGENDGPVFLAAHTGISTHEDSAAPTLTGDGSIVFSDLDLSDSHTVSTSAAADNTLPGSFSATLVQAANQPGNGEVAWHFEVPNAAVQYLAAGQSVTNHYVVTIDDGHGGQLLQPIDVTVTGRNDGPAITAASAGATVTEDTLPTSATGLITFDDVDLTDAHTTSVVADGGNALGGVLTATVTQAATGAGEGSVTWHYAIDNAALQHLAQGQAVIEQFTVTIDDGHGGTVDQVVTVTVTGTNDAPDIQVIATDGAAATIDETDSGLTAGGTLTVTDADTSDSVSTVVTSVALSGATGTLSASDVLGMLNLAPNSGLPADLGDAHNLAWSFDSGSQAFDYLDAGQSLVLTYTVTGSDGHGGTDTQQIQVTINGTDDNIAPVASGEAIVISSNITTISKNWLLGNDSDADGGTLAIVPLSSGLAIDGSGNLTVTQGSLPAGTPFTPAGQASYTVYDLSYAVSDGQGGTSDPVTLKLAIVTTTSGAEVVNLNTVAGSLGGSYSYSMISAQNGNDQVTGTAALDTFIGGPGNDRLAGAAGADTLTGDQGSDTFVFSSLGGVDTVTDFRADSTGNRDFIELSALTFANIANSGATLSTGDFATINTAGTGDLSSSSVGAAVNVVFDTSTGALYYDANGGSLTDATQIALLQFAGSTAGNFGADDIKVGP